MAEPRDRLPSGGFKADPFLDAVSAARQVCWFNTRRAAFSSHAASLPIGAADVADASARLERFRPYIKTVFTETAPTQGLIESPLAPAPAMQQALSAYYGFVPQGRLLVKLDSHLPISGSIKARGGIYEVLKHAERLAIDHGMLNIGDNYAKLAQASHRRFYKAYSIAVGSTGNLGLAIGIMGVRLGFRVFVHMSANAKLWKKNLLRERGATVFEYADDYGQAVARGRKQAANDPRCYFVDDETSLDLFLGYAVAAERLAGQLAAMGIVVDAAHPLFVYLPCGVGGAPGGVTFGLKVAFGDAAHCFFAEPTHVPAMLIGLYTGLHDRICARDLGLDMITEADGLAVGRPSALVGRVVGPVMDGAYTIDDDTLFRLLIMLADSEGICLEPSALAGFSGMAHILGARDYLETYNLADKMDKATHIAWATGGSMAPTPEMNGYLQKGRALAAR